MLICIKSKFTNRKTNKKREKWRKLTLTYFIQTKFLTLT